ncbi:hypothetical protein HDV05_007562, partial [Chytridiales sp. JEL 0842]
SCTRLHAVRAKINFKLKKSEIARMFGKSKSTITSWILKFKEFGTVARKSSILNIRKKFGIDKRQWIVDFFTENPTTHLYEASDAFKKQWKIAIGKSSIWKILDDAGFSYKVLERVSSHIKERDIIRYTNELNSLSCHLWRYWQIQKSISIGYGGSEWSTSSV